MLTAYKLPVQPVDVNLPAWSRFRPATIESVRAVAQGRQRLQRNTWTQRTTSPACRCLARCSSSGTCCARRRQTTGASTSAATLGGNVQVRCHISVLAKMQDNPDVLA